MTNRIRYIPLGLTLALLLALSVAACGGGDSSSASPTAASGSPGPTQASNPMAIESARQYLQDTGVDDTKGDLTDPRACSQVTDGSSGRFCIHDPPVSTYAAGLVILVIGNKDDPDKQTWEVRLQPNDAGWHVISAKPYGSRE